MVHTNYRSHWKTEVSVKNLIHILMLNGRVVHGISLAGEEKVYGVKDLPKSQVLSSE